MTLTTIRERADLLDAVVTAAPAGLPVAAALDIVDAVVATLEAVAVAALFESAGIVGKGTRPSPPRSAGENDGVLCPCGDHPARRMPRPRAMPGRDVDALVVFEGDQ